MFDTFFFLKIRIHYLYLYEYTSPNPLKSGKYYVSLLLGTYHVSLFFMNASQLLKDNINRSSPPLSLEAI